MLIALLFSQINYCEVKLFKDSNLQNNQTNADLAGLFGFQKEEEKRRQEERRKAEEERQQLERDRKDREAKEAAQRDKWDKERATQIDQQK